MEKITEKAYAKINLYLDVVEKRDDGYHNIKSVMHTTGFYDVVKVQKSADISMICSDPTLSCGEDNLCIKAARAFFSHLNEDGGCFIELEKTIPREAGLGGGSADGAAVLRALNGLYGEPFSVDELCSVGAEIGADVPFCIVGGSCLCEGIGEIMSPFPHLPECSIVISGGIGSVSTPQAYKMIDSISASRKGDLSLLLNAMKKSDLSLIGKALYNRFEDVVPDCERVKTIMLEYGAEGALMSGSGPSVFGLFSSRKSASSASEALKKYGLSAFVC